MTSPGMTSPGMTTTEGEHHEPARNRAPAARLWNPFLDSQSPEYDPELAARVEPGKPGPRQAQAQPESPGPRTEPEDQAEPEFPF
jgi:hypothetical protein